MTVALCLIVKNEAAVLPRVIASVRDHIDYWVVCDTGSTDGTQALLRAQMREANIPGELHEKPWQNFGHNRTEMLQFARGKADWLLLLDADWTLQVDGELQSMLTVDSSPDCWSVAATGNTHMTHKVFLRGDKPWKAVGTVHEFIDCDEPFTDRLLKGATWTHHADGGERAGRADRDEVLLRADVDLACRPLFYLAQTLRDAGRTDEAAKAYLQRASMGGSIQERFFSLYQAGMIRNDLGLLLEAWALLPERLEPVYEIAWRLRQRGQHQAALDLLEGLSEPTAPADGLWLQFWVWDWGLDFECACAIQNTGQDERARHQWDFLIEHGDLPEAQQAAAIANRALLDEPEVLAA